MMTHPPSTLSYAALEQQRNELLVACKRALVWIEGDESAHGREFGAGNQLRKAIANAERDQ